MFASHLTETLISLREYSHRNGAIVWIPSDVLAGFRITLVAGLEAAAVGLSNSRYQNPLTAYTVQLVLAAVANGWFSSSNTRSSWSQVERYLGDQRAARLYPSDFFFCASLSRREDQKLVVPGVFSITVYKNCFGPRVWEKLQAGIPAFARTRLENLSRSREYFHGDAQVDGEGLAALAVTINVDRDERLHGIDE